MIVYKLSLSFPNLINKVGYISTCTQSQLEHIRSTPKIQSVEALSSVIRRSSSRDQKGPSHG